MMCNDDIDQLSWTTYTADLSAAVIKPPRAPQTPPYSRRCPATLNVRRGLSLVRQRRLAYAVPYIVANAFGARRNLYVPRKLLVCSAETIYHFDELSRYFHNIEPSPVRD